MSAVLHVTVLATPITHTVYDGKIGCGDGGDGISVCGDPVLIEVYMYIDAFVDCLLITGTDCEDLLFSSLWQHNIIIMIQALKQIQTDTDTNTPIILGEI